MNESRQTEPPEDPAGRREQVVERTRHLRSLGVAGAVAALGVFTGLAATSHSTPAATQSSQPAVDAASQSTQVDDGLDSAAQNGFFDTSPSPSSSGVSAGSGPGASVMSGGS